jgi:hypothetical protein
MNPRLLTDSSLIVAAVFYGGLLALAMAAGLLGIWLGIVISLSLWRHCYAVLRSIAQGRRRIPTPEPKSLNPAGEFALVWHFVAFPALLIVLAVVHPFGQSVLGQLASIAAGIAVIFVLPASAATMALTSSLEAAFNPANIAHVVRTFGRDYYVLVAACIAILLATGITNAYVFPILGFLAGIGSDMLTVWAVLVVFALTGSLLRTHRNDFDIPGERETNDEWQARAQRDEWRKTLDLAYASISRGLVAEGYELLHRLSAESGDSLEIRYWLFDNMLTWEDRSHALQIAARLIERHVEDGENYSAFELFVRCRGLERNFSVEPPIAAALADFARSIGRQGLADELSVVTGR